MKTVLWITSMCLFLLFLLPIPGSCNAEHTALEDFSNSLKSAMSEPVDLSAYGLNCASAAIEEQKLVITPNYPSAYMSYCYFLSNATVKKAFCRQQRTPLLY